MKAELRREFGHSVMVRHALGDKVVELGELDPNIVVMTADLAKCVPVFYDWGKRHPDRFFNVGAAEQNMMGVAAGMASAGLTPICYTFAVFASMRAAEQVRSGIAYPNLNVKLLASNAGLSVGENGVSHQAIEDLAIMRSFPNMVVLAPCDGLECRAAVTAAVLHDGPVYLRVARSHVPTLFNSEYRFEIGKALLLREGRDLTIATTGIMLQTAVEALPALEREGIDVEIVHFPTVKPLDDDALLRSVAKTRHVIACEDHSIVGGFGGAVSECIAQSPTQAQVTRFGVRDVFAESGPPAALFAKYRLDASALVDEARLLLATPGRAVRAVE